MNKQTPRPVFPFADAMRREIEKEQIAKGLTTYGVPLSTHNGRDALRDMLQEMHDAWQYGNQAMMERDEMLEYIEQLEAANESLRRRVAELEPLATREKVRRAIAPKAALRPGRKRVK